MVRQVPIAARMSSIGSMAESVPPSGAGSSVWSTNERAVVRACAPSCQLVTVLNVPVPALGSAVTAALVVSYAATSREAQLLLMGPHLSGRLMRLVSYHHSPI